MAIVFISPQKKRRKFVLAIGLVVFLAIIAVPVAVFFEDAKSFLIGAPLKQNISAQEVKINLKAINSKELENLKLFEELKTEFFYTAKNQQAEQISGSIFAVSKKSVIEQLNEIDLEVLEINQANAGRQEPFSPY